jgi:hypothetical protein
LNVFAFLFHEGFAASLPGRKQSSNMELGALFTFGELSAKVQEHFDGLIDVESLAKL